MRRYLIADYERTLAHIEEVLGIILNDCEIMLDLKNLDNSHYERALTLHKGVAHIQGLCNGVKKHIDKLKEV